MSWKLIYFEDHWAWQARTNDPIFLARISIENCSRAVCSSTSQSSLHTYNTADTLSANAFFCGDKNIDFSIEDQQGITRKKHDLFIHFCCFHILQTCHKKHLCLQNTYYPKEESSYVLRYCAEKILTNYWQIVVNVNKNPNFILYEPNSKTKQINTK